MTTKILTVELIGEALKILELVNRELLIKAINRIKTYDHQLMETLPISSVGSRFSLSETKVHSSRHCEMHICTHTCKKCLK